MSSNPSQLGKVEAKGENEAREQGIRKEHGDEKENVNAQNKRSSLVQIDNVQSTQSTDKGKTTAGTKESARPVSSHSRRSIDSKATTLTPEMEKSKVGEGCEGAQNGQGKKKGYNPFRRGTQGFGGLGRFLENIGNF